MHKTHTNNTSWEKVWVHFFLFSTDLTQFNQLQYRVKPHLLGFMFYFFMDAVQQEKMGTLLVHRRWEQAQRLQILITAIILIA